MSNQEYTVNHAIDTLGFGYYQFLLSFIVGMAWVADAMEMMILRLRPFGFLSGFPPHCRTCAQHISCSSANITVGDLYGPTPK